MRETPDVDFIAVQEALAGEYSLERELGPWEAGGRLRTPPNVSPYAAAV